MKMKLLLSVIVVGMGLLFSSCTKDEIDPIDYLKVGDVFYGSPEWGSSMEKHDAKGGFEYSASGGNVNLYVNSPEAGTMERFVNTGNSCIDGDTIKFVSQASRS